MDQHKKQKSLIVPEIFRFTRSYKTQNKGNKYEYRIPEHGKSSVNVEFLAVWLKLTTIQSESDKLSTYSKNNSINLIYFLLLLKSIYL